MKIIDDVKAALSGLLSPEKREVITGNLEIRQVFTISKTIIAGSYGIRWNSET